MVSGLGRVILILLVIRRNCVSLSTKRWKRCYVIFFLTIVGVHSKCQTGVFWEYVWHGTQWFKALCNTLRYDVSMQCYCYYVCCVLWMCYEQQEPQCSQLRCQLRCRKFRLDQLIQLQQKDTGGTDAYRCDSWIQLSTGASAAAVCPIRVTQLRHLRRKSAKVFRRYVFSCDQAALQMVLSVCPSLRPSVPPFSLCSHHRIIIKFWGMCEGCIGDVFWMC